MGMYYKPGSLKAKLCVEGGEMMYNYLDSKGLPYKKCGKVIVAVDEEEVPQLKNLYIRACANRCKDIKMITAEELKQLEPHCNVCGMPAILQSKVSLTGQGAFYRTAMVHD